MSDREEMVALADWLSGQQSYHDSSVSRNDPFIQTHIERLRQWEKIIRSTARTGPDVAGFEACREAAIAIARQAGEPYALNTNTGAMMFHAVTEKIAAAIAALPAPTTASAGWQDIETAPKDGTDIILGALEQTYEGQPVASRVTIGHWTTDEECREQIGDCGGECRCPEYRYHDPSWISWDGGFTEQNQPTHWMPLPAAPTKRS